MKQCTIFFTNNSPTEVVNTLRGCTAKSLVSAEVDGTTITFNQKLGGTLTLHLPEEIKSQELFTKYKEELQASFEKIDTPYESLKENIIKQIPHWNLALRISLDGDINEETNEYLQKGIMDTIKFLSGFLLTEEMTLYNEEGELLLNAEGESEVYDFEPILPAHVGLVHESQPSQEDKDRYARTLDYVKEKGIPTMEEHMILSLHKSEAKLRSVEEAVNRLLALLTVARFTDILMNPEGGPQEAQATLHATVDKFNLLSCFSEKELHYLRIEQYSTPLCQPFLWCYVDVELLCWALGLLDDFGDLHQVYDVNVISKKIDTYQDRESLISACSLRPIDELLQQQDLMMKCHWACVELLKSGQELPEILDMGIVAERHKTLNWLVTEFYGDDWDNIQSPA